MTKKSTILKTTLFLVLLSMTQDLYAGACQSIISEETSLKSTSTFQTPSLEEEKTLHKKTTKRARNKIF